VLPVRRLGLALTLALALLAAVPAEGAAPLERYTVPGVGFSIGVPSGWKAFDYRQVATSALVSRLERENPTLARLFAAIRDPRSGVRFFAADTHATQGFATNLNLVVETIPAGFGAAQYADAATSQLTSVPNVIRPVRRKAVRLPAGPSVRLRYGLRFTVAGNQVVVAITQYALVRGTRAYVVTYTTLPSRSAELSTLFEMSARSIRLS
jgi:hypothetical protein